MLIDIIDELFYYDDDDGDDEKDGSGGYRRESVLEVLNVFFLCGE